MRKRNISFIADKFLWFVILILPLLFALVFTIASNHNYKFSQDMVTYEDSLAVSHDLILTIDGYNNFGGSLYFAMDSSPYDEQYTYVFSEVFSALTLNLHNYLGPPNYGQMISDGSTYAFFTRTGNTFIFNDITYYEYVPLFDIGGILQDFTGFIENYGVDTDLGYGVEFTLSGSYVLTQIEVTTTDSSTYFYSYFDSLNHCLDSWFTFGSNDIVYTSFNSIFGSQSSILPIFSEGSFIPKYLTYMAWIYVLHIAFDFLVFIPRLAHKWMGGVYKDEDS